MFNNVLSIRDDDGLITFFSTCFFTCFSEADLCSSETYQSYVYSHIFHDISVRLIAMYTHVFSDISVGLTRVTNFFSISRVS